MKFPAETMFPALGKGLTYKDDIKSACECAAIVG